MKLWKVLGVAGFAGVAATGVVVARAERRRRAYEPDDVRARLQERYREAAGTGADSPPVPVVEDGGSRLPRGRAVRSWLGRAVPRRRRRR